jgi:hypothetical protein
MPTLTLAANRSGKPLLFLPLQSCAPHHKFAVINECHCCATGHKTLQRLCMYFGFTYCATVGWGEKPVPILPISVPGYQDLNGDCSAMQGHFLTMGIVLLCYSHVSLQRTHNHYLAQVSLQSIALYAPLCNFVLSKWAFGCKCLHPANETRGTGW